MERKEFSIARFLSSKSRFDNIVLLYKYNSCQRSKKYEIPDRGKYK